MRNLDWQDHARGCREDSGFTVDRKPGMDEMARLWGICIKCPVMRDCALHALSQPSGGVYAGVYVPGRGSRRTAARARLERKAERKAGAR